VITVSELHVYPLKSCAGIQLPAVTVAAYGFAHDREFMVVDSHDHLITQRTAPTLVHVQPELDATYVHLSAPGFQRISVPLYNPTTGDVNARRMVTVFQEHVCADDMGDEAAGWFSDFLRQPARLVRRGAAFVRTARKGIVAGQNALIAFPDAYPFHLVAEETVAELNTRLPNPVAINGFRPNIVIRGGLKPYLEDSWQKITIGNVVFHHGEPCGRCSVITVDQKSGTVGKEPLKTLTPYRRSEEGKVRFGVYLISSQTSGEVRVGDAVHTDPAALRRFFQDVSRL
jgi:uncharacterized protein